VLEDLDGRIDAVLEAGPTAFGLESTVLDPNASPMIVYRPGAVALNQIRAVAGPAELYIAGKALAGGPRESLPSPGVGIRHYAPRARLILVEAEPGRPCSDLASLLYSEAAVHSHRQLGVMLPLGMPGEHSTEESKTHLAFANIYCWGNWADPEQLAHRLFAGLRHLDAAGCQIILCPVPNDEGIGAAIRDRLRKAAWSPSESAPG
jgi:L-threonylcarbamoyladenylate synthase